MIEQATASDLTCIEAIIPLCLEKGKKVKIKAELNALIAEEFCQLPARKFLYMFRLFYSDLSEQKVHLLL